MQFQLPVSKLLNFIQHECFTIVVICWIDYVSDFCTEDLKNLEMFKFDWIIFQKEYISFTVWLEYQAELFKYISSDSAENQMFEAIS